ncbi:helix-turn-helix transcriptional regulator [Agrobacterium sp. Ap1]|nr:helix-turn-helix transcriptional regulator [Agrobacterium sp. Ap1]
MNAIEIKALRDKLDWTQAQLAEYLGVDRSTISRMENGGKVHGPAAKLLSSLRDRYVSSEAAE